MHNIPTTHPSNCAERHGKDLLKTARFQWRIGAALGTNDNRFLRKPVSVSVSGEVAASWFSQDSFLRSRNKFGGCAGPAHPPFLARCHRLRYRRQPSILIGLLPLHNREELALQRFRDGP